LNTENFAQSTVRVLIFAVRNSEYPRHQLLKKKLLLIPGVEVTTVMIDWEAGQFLRLFRLFVEGWRGSRGTSVVFVSEFGLQYAPLGWAISRLRGARLVVDHFVGTYETHVLDHRTHTRTSLRGRYFAGVDRMAYWLADVVTIDTRIRASKLSARFPRRAIRAVALPVGAPAWARERGRDARVDGSPLKVLFYGNYLPLHGVPYVIEALAHIPSDTAFEIEIVGSSPQRESAEIRVKEIGRSDSVTFTDALPEGILSEKIRRADVVLGVYGDTFKARTVVANKVWQGLYMGKTVITRKSAAVSELAQIVGDQLLLVNPDDPQELADHIVRLSRGPEAAQFEPLIHELDRFVDEGYEVLFSRLGLRSLPNR